MESITLQTSDSVVASGDILGRLSFAASNEASAGDSLLIGGMIRAEAEGEFTSTANPTSIIFSTGASETAQDKLKITSVGDVVPVNHNQNDLGSSSSKFKNVYVGNQVNVASGIVINSGIPTSTSNALYNNSGVLYFSGSAVGGGLSNGSVTYANIQQGSEASILLGTPSTATDPTWEDSVFRSEKTLVAIQASKINGDISDYHFTITESMLPTGIWANAQNGGGDIRVACNGSQVAIDVVDFDTSAETCQIECLVPFVSSSTNTPVYVYYNTATTTSQPAAGHAYGSNNARRSNNKQHISFNGDPTGSAPQFADRTSNGYDMTLGGTWASGDSVSGVVGSALDFERNTGQYAKSDIGAALKVVGTGDYAIFGMINRPSTGRDDIFIWKEGGGDDDIGVIVINGTEKVYAFTKWDGGAYENAQSTGTVATGVYQQVGFIRKSGTVYPILNGSTAGTTFSSSHDLSLHSGTNEAWYGCNHASYVPNGLGLTGSMDEFSVFTGPFGDDIFDFIAARYENLKNQAAFAVASAPEAVAVNALQIQEISIGSGLSMSGTDLYVGLSATDKILGRSSAGAGSVEEITCTAAGRALLDDADASAQRETLGIPMKVYARVAFNGTGTVAIRESYNVSSITDNGAGDYTINFTNELPNTNYSILGTCAHASNGSVVFAPRDLSAARSTTACRVSCVMPSVNMYDCPYVDVVIIGAG